MACFSDYILVRGHCGNTLPSTGLYINDLPGITVKIAANVADDEVVSGINLLNRCIDEGIRQARHDIVSKMRNVVSFDKIQHNQDYGFFTDTYLSTSNTTRGLKVTIDDCCRLTGIFIKQLTLKANTTISNKTISIVDGNVTTNYTVDLTAGVETTIYPNYKATEETVYIQWNTSDISVNDSTVFDTSSGAFPYASCHDWNCTQNECGHNGITVVGTDDTDKSYGIRALVQVRCDEDQFTCEISDQLAYACRYSAAMKFVEEWKMTTRINAPTNYGKERYDEQYLMWEEKYHEELNSIVEKLPTWLAQVAPCCVECSSDHWTYQHP